LDIITNNKNIILDKKALKANENGGVLNIYYGSDFGFCGNLNSLVNSKLSEDKNSDKIVIGRKLRRTIDNTILYIAREELETSMAKIEGIIFEKIKNMQYKSINLIYFEYKSVSELSLTKRKVFPTEVGVNQEDYNDDFSFEGEIENILFNVLISYIGYQIRLADINCRASENILRQNVTSESLKKIDEYEEENKRVARKEVKQKNFQKVVESYSKTKIR
ncbi:MAG: F0F1 ATP synthase subunit gamma, partial [Oscillospiraceae bacterium]